VNDVRLPSPPSSNTRAVVWSTCFGKGNPPTSSVSLARDMYWEQGELDQLPSSPPSPLKACALAPAAVEAMQDPRRSGQYRSPSPGPPYPAASYYSPALTAAISSSSPAPTPPAFPVAEIPAALLPGQAPVSPHTESFRLNFSSPSPMMSPPGNSRPGPAFPRAFQSAPTIPQYPYQQSSYPYQSQQTHTTARPPWNGPQRTSPELPASYFPTNPHFSMPPMPTAMPTMPGEQWRHSSHDPSDFHNTPSRPMSVYPPRVSSAAQLPSEKVRLEVDSDALPRYSDPAPYQAEADPVSMEEALALSLKHHEEEQAALARQEEEELAKALAESALGDHFDFPIPSAATSSSATPLMPEPTVSDEGSSSASHSYGSMTFSSHPTFSTATSNPDEHPESATWPAKRNDVLEQMRQDEELARRLAADDDSVPTTQEGALTKGQTRNSWVEPSAPPAYKSGEPTAALHPDTEASDTATSPLHRSQSAGATLPGANLGYNGQAAASNGKIRSNSVGPPPTMIQNQWNVGTLPPGAAGSSASSLRSPRTSVMSHGSAHLPAVGEDEHESWRMPEAPSTPLPDPLPTHTVVDEMLMGVCECR
jgi:hypothetical protein